MIFPTYVCQRVLLIVFFGVSHESAGFVSINKLTLSSEGSSMHFGPMDGLAGRRQGAFPACVPAIDREVDAKNSVNSGVHGRYNYNTYVYIYIYICIYTHTYTYTSNCMVSKVDKRSDNLGHITL